MKLKLPTISKEPSVLLSCCVLEINSADPDLANTCPVCNSSKIEGREGKRKASPMSEWFDQLDSSGPSTKAKALIENIYNAREQGSAEPGRGNRARPFLPC
jgi:hypothetical protein